MLDHLDAVGAVEHERQAVEGLLVARHQRQQLLDVEAARAGVIRNPYSPATMRAVLVDALVVDAAEFAGELGREDQPDRDRLAVGEVVVGGDLERMGEGVAVVEQRPATALALVGGNDLGLDLDAAGDALARVASPAGRRR